MRSPAHARAQTPWLLRHRLVKTSEAPGPCREREWVLRPHAQTAHPRNHRRPLAKGCKVLAAGWRWRLRAQAPFAVSVTAWGHPRLDEATLRDPRWLPASVGRRTQATPPPCRANGWGGESGWKNATRQKGKIAARLQQAASKDRHART